uniref:Toll-like receptor 13 n=1 Tax=Petromyzon marinus TaxID=7757 RepID=A0AAJ7XFI9_PETMA|nr:toll-like receptor 13 [Petromyzon marinus]
MEEVERGALGGLPALREVYLGANSLSTFPASAFAPPLPAPAPTAASVLIDGDSDNTVGDVGDAGSCDVANADVSVRSGGSGSSGVATLDLGSNSISLLHTDDLRWLLELRTLNLSKNQITEVSSGFLRGPRRLRRLLMSANRLMSVAGIFPEDLGLLEALDLRSNYLSKLPAGNFANLTSLLLLNVADNQIAEAEDGAFDGLASLGRFDLGGNKLGLQPLGPRAFEGLVNLTNLEFNNNYLHYASAGAVRSPLFAPLRSLTHLFLNSQRRDSMVNFPSNFLEGLATLQELHAGELYLSVLDAGTFLPTPNLRCLDLGSNPLCGVEPALLRPVPLLDELHLRGVRLDDVAFLSWLNLSLLRVLRVSNNRVGEVSAAELGALPRLQLLDVVGNPLSCGCDNAWLRDFLLNSSRVQAPGLWRVRCGFPLSRRGELFVRFDASQCRDRSRPLLFACCSCAVALVMLTATVFRFWRWHLLYGYHLLAAWLGERGRPARQPGPIRYDAFVSYNSDDEEWVAHQLLPQLEGAGMRLCLHHRDFVPGKDIVDNIMDGIYASRRTLCVVTRSYLRSEWCSKELQVAAFRLFEENQDVLVLLFLEHIPHNELSAYFRMRRTIRSRTYITWPGAREDSFARRGRRGRSVAPAGSEGACKLFWHRVVGALGPGGRGDEGCGVAEEGGPLGALLVHAC